MEDTKTRTLKDAQQDYSNRHADMGLRYYTISKLKKEIVQISLTLDALTQEINGFKQQNSQVQTVDATTFEKVTEGTQTATVESTMQ